MRRGITLLITLIAVVVVMGSVALIVKNSERLIKPQSSQMIAIEQSVTQDLLILMNKMKIEGSGEVNEDSLDMLMMIPIMNVEDDSKRYSILLEFFPKAKGLNPALLLKDATNVNVEQKKIWINLLYNYNVADPELLVDILVDMQDKDLYETNSNSEPGLYDVSLNMVKFDSFDKFNKALGIYAHISGDEKVHYIEWKNIIAFDTKAINLNFISKELLMAILPDLDIDTATLLTEGRIEAYKNIDSIDLITVSQKAILKKDDLKIVTFDPVVECNIEVTQVGRVVNMKFDFNINTKEVSNKNVWL